MHVLTYRKEHKTRYFDCDWNLYYYNATTATNRYSHNITVALIGICLTYMVLNTKCGEILKYYY